MIQIVIVDDDSNCVVLIERILKKTPGMDVIGSFACGEDMLAAAPSLCPDVVLMDHKLPGEDGIAITQTLKRLLPLTKVIILTGNECPFIAERAVRAGVEGFLLKDDQPRVRIPDAIERVNAGVDMILTSKSQRHIIERFRWISDIMEALWPRLTDKETEVMELVKDGYVGKEIAERLRMSENTVETHIRNIRKKSTDRTMPGIIKQRAAFSV